MIFDIWKRITINKNYITFNCLKCKNEITVKKCNSNSITIICDNCYIDLDRMAKLLNNSPSVKKENILTKEKLDSIDNYYFNRKDIPESLIDKQYIYTSLDSLFLDTNTQIKAKDEGFHADKKDFLNFFKDAKYINRRIVDLSTFHYLEFKDLKKMILCVYPDISRPFSILNDQSSIFHDSLGTKVEVIFSVRTVNDKKEERVEIFY